MSILFAGFFKRFFGEKGFSKILTDDAVTVTIPGRKRPFTMASDHKLFEALVEALKQKNEQAVLGIVAVVEEVTKYVSVDVSKSIEIKGGQILYKGQPCHNVVCDRILQFIAEGIPCDYLLRFLERVMKNPLESAREELFLFLENGNLPLMTDGRFMAYKWVNNRMYDCHSDTFNNAPGQIVRIDRKRCNTDRNQTCAAGLHVCTQNYTAFGQRLMLVAIDPADVVSVPHDYNNAKMRVCEYEVLEEIKGGKYGEVSHQGIKQYKPALTEAERRKQVKELSAITTGTGEFEDEDLSMTEGNVTLVTENEPDPTPVEEPVSDTSSVKVKSPYPDAVVVEAGDYQVRLVNKTSDKVIPAIKALRKATGFGLKEAKDIIDGPLTIMKNITEELANTIKQEMKNEGVTVRVELVKKVKKVAKPKKTAKSKASEPKKEQQLMDDATWTQFKKDVRNKKGLAKYGLSDEDTKKLRQKAKEENNGGKV